MMFQVKENLKIWVKCLTISKTTAPQLDGNEITVQNVIRLSKSGKTIEPNDIPVEQLKIMGEDL